MKDNQDFSCIPELLAFSQPAWFCPVRLYRLLLCYWPRAVAQQESVDQTNTVQQGFMFCFVCLKDILVRYLTGDAEPSHSLWLNLKQSVCFS